MQILKMQQRRAPAAAALLALALTLTACGSDSAPSDKIEGAGNGSKSAAPESPSPTADDAERPKMRFPKDIKIVFEDWKTSEGPKSQAALDDAANFVRSIMHGIAQQDTHDPAYMSYSSPLGGAQSYAKHIIEENVKDNLTVTGTDVYYRPSVRVSDSKKLAEVTFCEDQSKIYSKEVKTGKVHRTEKSSSSFLSYKIAMQPVPGKRGDWWAMEITIDDGGQKCER